MMDAVRPNIIALVPGADWNVLEASATGRLVVVRCVESPEIALAVDMSTRPYRVLLLDPAADGGRIPWLRNAKVVESAADIGSALIDRSWGMEEVPGD